MSHLADLERFRAVIADIRQRREDGRAVPLKGKKYTTVQDRIEAFRSQFGAEYGIETFVDCGDYGKGKPVMARCIIKNEAERIVATGHAVEFWGSSNVNSTSALENAETSAIGRALATLGIHGGEFASANEIEGVDRKGQSKDTGDGSVPPEQKEVVSNGSEAHPPPPSEYTEDISAEWTDETLEAQAKALEKRVGDKNTVTAVIKLMDDPLTVAALSAMTEGRRSELKELAKTRCRDIARKNVEDDLRKQRESDTKSRTSSAAEYARQTRGE
jgi:hypothetical protein